MRTGFRLTLKHLVLDVHVNPLRLPEPVLVDDLFFESKHVGVVEIDDNPDPVRLGEAKGFHPGEVFNLAPEISGTRFLASKQGLVDAEEMRIAMHENHWLAKSRNLSLKVWDEVRIPRRFSWWRTYS